MVKYFIIIFFFSILSFSSFSHARDLTDAEICRAGIATVMGKDIDLVHIDKEHKKISFISYEEKDEETDKISVWKFKCYLENFKIMWATEMGGWRDSHLDSLVEFEIKNGDLIVQEKHNNGSVFKRTFKK